MIQGTTDIYGVIGAPIEHSMSPQMQNFYAEKMKLNMAYVPFFVLPEQLGDALQGSLALHIKGLNVTVPHKQAVIPYLAEVDETAKVIGAVNTLVYTDGGYRGYNTDASGLLRAMKEEQMEINHKSCIILGAGGAAKAAAYMLAKENAKVIYVINRSLDKARTLCREINAVFKKSLMRAVALDDYNSIPHDRYLVIQATNVGMHPYVDECLIKDENFYKMVEIGVDIIYTPEETAFMRQVKAAGGKVMNGLTMLLYQGIEAFYLWNPGVVLDQDTILQAKDLMLNHLRG